MASSDRSSNWWQRIHYIREALRTGLRPLNAVGSVPPRSGVHKGEISWIDPDGLAESLGQAAAPVIVDVRGPEEFDGDLGHLAEARNIALPELLGRIGELAPYRDRDLVLVCHTQMRSARAATLLRGANFRKVAVLRGGMVEWRRRGLPIADQSS